MKKAEAAMRTFTAVYQRDPADAWSAQLMEEPAVISWGRTLAGAQQHLREAARLWFDVDDLASAGIELVTRVEFGGIADELAQLRQRRGELAVAEHQVSEQTRLLARRLVDDGLSLRDAAAALGVSFQRIAQVVGPATGGGRPRPHRGDAAAG